jgi:hypothetical protein
MKTAIEQPFDVLSDGTIQLRIVIDHEDIAGTREFHRMTLAPGDDIDEIMAALNVDIPNLYPGAAIPADDILDLKEKASMVWTPEVIEAYREAHGGNPAEALDEQILAAPDDLTGGPTLREIFEEVQ